MEAHGTQGALETFSGTGPGIAAPLIHFCAGEASLYLFVFWVKSERPSCGWKALCKRSLLSLLKSSNTPLFLKESLQLEEAEEKLLQS